MGFLIQKQMFKTKGKLYKPLKTSGLRKRNLRQQVTLLLIRLPLLKVLFLKNLSLDRSGLLLQCNCIASG